jgi:hypothetical protein
MSGPKEHRTRSGRTLTDEDIDAIAREVEETDYDVEGSQDPAAWATPHGLRTGRCRPGENRP